MCSYHFRSLASDVVSMDHSSIFIHSFILAVVLFAQNKDDDSFATILMFLSSTFLWRCGLESKLVPLNYPAPPPLFVNYLKFLGVSVFRPPKSGFHETHICVCVHHWMFCFHGTWPVRFTSRRALPSSVDAFEFCISSRRKLNKEPWLDAQLLWPAAWELRGYTQFSKHIT